MREYTVTKEGQDLAQQTGLDTLAHQLHHKGYNTASFILPHLTETGYRWQNDSEDREAEVRSLRQSLKSADETLMFDRALSIDPKTDNWRHIGNYEEDTLFPARSVTAFTPACEEDSLILSGAAGLSLVSYRQQCPLLARSRYQEFGFKSFIEACSFVGAYVVGRHIDLELERLRGADPAFQYAKDGFLYSLRVGGSFHGDFRMTESKQPQSGILSPVNSLTEISPRVNLGVAGYHSIEPEIVATLIEAEFLRGGKTAAMQLVTEFTAAMVEVTDSPEDTGVKSIGFADYGDGDIKHSLVSLELLLTHDDYNPLKHGAILHSTPYLPRSATRFEIALTDTGVKFQNRDENQDEVPGIHLDREQYVAMFMALIRQTSAALGRTAPKQLIQIVDQAKSLLDGNT